VKEYVELDTLSLRVLLTRTRGVIPPGDVAEASGGPGISVALTCAQFTERQAAVLFRRCLVGCGGTPDKLKRRAHAAHRPFRYHHGGDGSRCK
jgi:hypothetical protein